MATRRYMPNTATYIRRRYPRFPKRQVQHQSYFDCHWHGEFVVERQFAVLSLLTDAGSQVLNSVYVSGTCLRTASVSHITVRLPAVLFSTRFRHLNNPGGGQ